MKRTTSPDRAALGELGLGPLQARVLGTVGDLAAEHGATYTYELERTLGATIRRGALVRAVAALRERGLIREVANSARPGVAPTTRLVAPAPARTEAQR